MPVKKKPGRPPKNPAAADSAPASTGAKRGRKPKNAGAAKVGEDLDLSDIEDDLVGEPVAETTEKVKPLRMKISKAKERALMKEFGLDETVLSEEDMLKRRMRLKTLIKLGKTRATSRMAKFPITCPTSWSTPRRWKSSSTCSTTWAWPCTSRRRTPKPCC